MCALATSRGLALRRLTCSSRASTNRSDLVVARSGHGLTAETVVVALEDIEDYQAFEADVIADYDARTAVERELVLCLASLLWRMRRATGIETDLLQIQAEILSDRRYEYETGDDTGQKPQSVVYRLLQRVIGPNLRRHLGKWIKSC
jgi:hypothetical protein